MDSISKTWTWSVKRSFLGNVKEFWLNKYSCLAFLLLYICAEYFLINNGRTLKKSSIRQLSGFFYVNTTLWLLG